MKSMNEIGLSVDGLKLQADIQNYIFLKASFSTRKAKNRY